MFDLKESLELEINDKVCEVRMPTDQEWADRYDKRYTIIRNMSGGTTDSKTMNREKADAELLALIQLNKGAANFDEEEAVTLMEQLSTCDVVDAQKNGNDAYVITLSTLLGEVKHYVKKPNHKDLKFAVEACVRMRGERHNANSIRLNLMPAKELYAKIFEKVEGYNPVDDVNLIPLVHKYKVIDVIQGEVSRISVKPKTKSVDPFPTTLGPTIQD